jgi:RNA polymerase sigma-70 factor (ECF subfamily)
MAFASRVNCPVNTDREIPRPELRLVGAPPDFRQVYEALYQPVADYLYRRLGDRHDTEDSLHDVFLAVYRALGRFRDRGVPLRHWVFRIASRAASRRLRRRQLELRALQHGLGSRDASTAADLGATTADSLRALLAALPRDLQDAVSLHYLAELPIDDVAAILRVPAGTVKSRLSRARELLRAHLERGGST